MLTLTEIWEREPAGVTHCRYPLTDESPHYFCGEGVPEGRSYCRAHDKLCYAGQGKPWEALAGMIDNVETTIQWKTPDRDEQPALDDELAGAASVFDKPGGLMGRT